MDTLEGEEDMEEEDMEGVGDAKLLTSKNVTPQANSNAPLLLINNVQQLMSNSARLNMSNNVQHHTKLLLNNSAALKKFSLSPQATYSIITSCRTNVLDAPMPNVY